MSTTEQFPATASGSTPDRRGQGTMVEQARAASEVQGQVYLAKQFPRDPMKAKSRMLEACAQMELAEAAFYSYPRGKIVTGLTIVAACEIALIWGNITYGTAELRRDDEYGQSEMNAYAWDMETNVRISSIFIVPHTRGDTRNSPRLVDARDIYETNTNNANRRMRAAILKTLPRWYVLAAETALRETLRRSVKESKKSLSEQIADAARWFEKEYGVTLGQLEHWADRVTARWDADDLVKLRTLGSTLKRGEIRVDEAFPQAKVTAQEIAGGAAPAETDTSQGAALHGPELMRRLEAQMRAALSADELEALYALAVEHRDAGSLTVDEFTQVDVAGSQRDSELAAAREADDEAHAEAVAQAWHGGDDADE